MLDPVLITGTSLKTLRKVRDGGNIPLKGWVQCFSMQITMNKCFLLNPEKYRRKFVFSFSIKMQKTHL